MVTKNVAEARSNSSGTFTGTKVSQLLSSQSLAPSSPFPSSPLSCTLPLAVGQRNVSAPTVFSSDTGRDGHGFSSETHMNPFGTDLSEVVCMDNKPARKFRAGAVSATIWQNQAIGKDGKPRQFASVNLERSYKDKNGEWKTTHSLGDSDLPKAIVLLSKAYEFLALRGGEAEQASSL